MLIVDSREKWTQHGNNDNHIRNYLDRNKIAYTVQKLDVGDYMIDGCPYASVDRKSGLIELSANLMNRKEASRFWSEVRRAHDSGTHLIVLIESGPKILSLKDLAQWKSVYNSVSGRNLVDQMVRIEYAYGVTWRFCSKRSTAKQIMEILKREQEKHDRLRLDDPDAVDDGGSA